ncbi:SHOCT domain-containing protein [Myroides sp. C8-3]|uniref:SHOCT domain-containing protein n=1 Tax=Myroides sp. C8-3 TaxID=3400533 RepID=UPI003D2F5617
MESYIYKIGKKNADDIKDMISVIIDRCDSKVARSGSSENIERKSITISDELIKLKELQENGILTEEEFLLQKNKILNG